MKRLKNLGVQFSGEEPALVSDSKVIFIHPRSTNGLLIELVEKDGKTVPATKFAVNLVAGTVFLNKRFHQVGDDLLKLPRPLGLDSFPDLIYACPQLGIFHII